MQFFPTPYLVLRSCYGLLMLLSVLVSVLSAQQQEKITLLGEMIPYTFTGATYVPTKSSVRGYLSVPEQPGAHPAIVLIHEWWGLNDDIKQKADRFAQAGYVAFAIDLYNGKATTVPAEARQLATAVRADVPKAFANIQAALSLLKNHPRVESSRIAAVGWCFGGGWSYQIAKNNLGVKAAVIYYGFFNPADDLRQMRAQLLGHFAENDRSIKLDTVREFQVKLATKSGDHEVYIYPNTTHGFASRKDANPVYNAAAAKIADERTLSFLKKHL